MVTMRIKSCIKRLFKSKSRWKELILTILILSFSITTYLVIKGKEKPLNKRFELIDKFLNEAINQYRLENLERAYSIFLSLYDSSENRDTRVFCALYLGNINYHQAHYGEAIEWYNKALLIDKKNFYAFHNIALSYLREGEAVKALKSIKMAYKLNPSFLPTLLLFGNIYYSISRYEDAIEVYDQGVEKEPLMVFNRAVSLFNLGKKEEGKRQLEELISQTDNFRLLKGLSYYLSGFISVGVDTNNAIQHFSHALEIFPSSPVVRYNLGLLYLNNANYKQAAQLFGSIDEKEFMKNNLEKSFNYLLGFTFWKNGDYSESLKRYLWLYEIEKNLQIAYIIGDIYNKMGEHSSAIQYYKEALSEKKNAGALFNLARLFIQMGDYRSAEYECRYFLELTSENPAPYICLAEIYFKQGNSEKALESLEYGVRLSGKDINNLFLCARLYQQNGFHNQALQIYYRIINLKASFYRAYENIAYIYLYNGNFKNARQVISRVINRVEDPDIYYRMAVLLALTEEQPDAEKIYKTLISEFPYRFPAYLNLSILFLRQGRYKQAISIAEQCMSSAGDINTDDLIKLYRVIGVAHLERGEILDGTRALEKASVLEKEDFPPKIPG